MTVKYFPCSVRARILDVIGKKKTGPATDRETEEEDERDRRERPPSLSCPPYFPLVFGSFSQFGSISLFLFCCCRGVECVLENNFDSLFSSSSSYVVSWRSLCVCVFVASFFFSLRAHRPRFVLCLRVFVWVRIPPPILVLSLSKWSLISLGILKKKKNPWTKSRESVRFLLLTTRLGATSSFFGSSLDGGTRQRGVLLLLLIFSSCFVSYFLREREKLSASLPLLPLSMLPPSFAFFFFKLFACCW